MQTGRVPERTHHHLHLANYQVLKKQTRQREMGNTGARKESMSHYC